MEQHSFSLPSKTTVFLMALAAGLTLTPQEMYAVQATQGVQQSVGKITGTVVDESGEAVIGATIKVKGANSGGGNFWPRRKLYTQRNSRSRT